MHVRGWAFHCFLKSEFWSTDPFVYFRFLFWFESMIRFQFGFESMIRFLYFLSLQYHAVLNTKGASKMFIYSGPIKVELTQCSSCLAN